MIDDELSRNYSAKVQKVLYRYLLFAWERNPDFQSGYAPRRALLSVDAHNVCLTGSWQSDLVNLLSERLSSIPPENGVSHSFASSSSHPSFTFSRKVKTTMHFSPRKF